MRAFLLLLLLAAPCFAKVSITGPGNPYTDDNPIPSKTVGYVSTANSTSTPLGSDATFTGSWESCIDCAVILVSVRPDVDSATNGFIVEFSANQSLVVSDDTYTIFANGGKTYSFQPAAQYFRVRYINGSDAQGSFVLTTQKKGSYSKPSSHRIGDTIVSEDDAELSKSAITGEDDNGNWQNVKTTQDGYLAVVDRSSGLSISTGDVTGYSTVHKFGNAPDFDTADIEVTIWDGAEDDTTWENMRYDYSTTADIDSISSSDAGDNQQITVQGLDSNSNLVSVTATLNGQTRVALGTNFYRVFRAYNADTTEFSGHVFVYPNTALSSGVPSDTSKIRIVIDPENQQTEMAVYTIPAGKTGHVRSFDVATAGASRSSEYVMKLYTRAPGGVFRLQKKIAISDTGNSSMQYVYVDPPSYAAGTDIEMTIQMLASGATAASISGGFDLVLIDQ